MNLCFLIGKIVSKIQFDFILNSKNIAIVRFELELSNKTIIKIKAYNQMADYVYRKFTTKDTVAIEGRIRTDGAIEITEIIKNNG